MNKAQEKKKKKIRKHNLKNKGVVILNVYSSLAIELNNNSKVGNNTIDIGEIKTLEPMCISLSDILLDEDDIILTDKIQKLIEPLIPDIECKTTCTGECSCTTESKIKEDKYEEDKLKVGDKVVLYSIEDGQKFIVLDRVYL